MTSSLHSKGRGITYYSKAACPHSDNSPFQACRCTNCTTARDGTNPCSGRPNTTTGVVYHCKSFGDNPLPYGSEFSWDSTGQEEAYVWGRYFNQTKLADRVLNAVLAYDPSTPSWAFNGGSLSYGDVGNNGIDVWNNNTQSVEFPYGE